MRFPLLAAVAASLTLPHLAGAGVEPTAPQQETPPGPGVRTSDACALCHDTSDRSVAMRDSAGRSVAPYDLWRSTMMANSARDPFWRAVLSAEMVAAPGASDAIAEKCLSCHSPLAHRVGLEDHDTGNPLHALDCEGELGDLARDGVSCTICHGMSPEGLGTPESFTAGFELDPWRRLFGPHEDPVPGPMRMHTGFTPTHGEHVMQSSMCGSCHTLVTHPLDEDDEALDIAFHEQTPYLEWRNSIFTNEAPDGTLLPDPGPMARTCQDCHVPRTDLDGERIRTRLAHNPPGGDFPFISEREPFGRHIFVGGNTLILTMLRDHAEELGVVAPREAFDATIAATRAQLENRSASLALSEVTHADGVASFDVTVLNHTGHKLPTGHPSRRMWLEVVARDAEGQVVFASGRHDEAGLIVGPDGAPLATEAKGGPVEPHRGVIDDPSEVARFRGVMADPAGAPTHTLLQGASWYVDDRILPHGWSADHPDAAATAPAGTDGDEGFEPGRARVRFSVPADGLLRVEARLLYQSVSPRWVAEIADVETPEVERFLRLWNAADRRPEVLASASSPE